MPCMLVVHGKKRGESDHRLCVGLDCAFGMATGAAYLGGCGSQATIYAIRDRRHLWGPCPICLVGSTVADLLIITVLAVRGIAMAPLSPTAVAPASTQRS
jgi:hypothetical protein